MGEREPGEGPSTSDLVGEDSDTYGPYGVRLLSVVELRQLAGLASVLYLVAGASVLQLRTTAAESIDHPGWYLAMGLLVVGASAGLAMAARLNDQAIQRLSVPMTLAALFAPSIVIPLSLWFVGFDSFAIGSATYVLPVVLGFYLLHRPLAWVLVGSVGTGHATLLATSEGVVAPISQFLFLMAIVAAAGVVVGGLTDKIDRSARTVGRARTILAEVNEELATRVVDQVDELERLGRLRRFLSPQVADAVLSSGEQDFLAPHRREISVFFCDLRGFTAFAAEVEPEEVLNVLAEYYEAVGADLHKFEATVGSFAGDGIMAYLNDPVPCEEPARQAVEMAIAIRESLQALSQSWERRGYRLGVGIGIATGHATIGVVGFDGRQDYTPLGTVVNRASRLCDEAAADVILVDRQTHLMSGDEHDIRFVSDLDLKGFPSPVPAFEVRGRPSATRQGSQS